MSDAQHIIDRRIELLAEAITREVNVIASFYAPPGGQQAMHEQVTSDQAYEFWSKHRYDEIGKQAISQMQPADVASIDRFLAEELNRRNPPAPQL